MIINNMLEKVGYFQNVLIGETNTLGLNEVRQVFIALEQGLEGFCNQHLATKTMNNVHTIRGL